MLLKEMTVNVLQNYVDISPKIIFNKNNEGFLTLSNEEKSVITFFELSEDEKKIPECGIYDLKSLLGILQELRSNEGFDIVFGDNFLTIKTKNSQVKYHYSPIDLLPEPPPRKSIDIEPQFSFILKSEHLIKLQKMAGLMNIENIQIEVIKKNVRATLKNINNDTSNSFKLILGQCSSEEIAVTTWKLETWKMINTIDYKCSVISINDKKISKFEAIDDKNKSLGLVYYIAVLAM